MDEMKLPPFIQNPFTNHILSLFDELREKKKTFGTASSMLVTGESGSGKSEIAKWYFKNNPIKKTEHQTHMPVLHFELRSVATQKEFLSAILIKIRDPQMGEGRNAGVLFERFVRLSKTIGIELIILDEIQVIIERRSQKVVTGLADLFKDLIKETNIPVVFLGMPWSTHLINSNPQLDGRVSYRYGMPIYKVSSKNSFDDYRRILVSLEKHYEFPKDVGLSKKEMALRCFSFSSGNIRQTTGLIRDVYQKSVFLDKKISKKLFVDVVKEYGVQDFNNPFLQNVENIVIREIVEQSSWHFGATANKNAIVEAQYQEFILTSDLKAVAKLA